MSISSAFWTTDYENFVYPGFASQTLVDGDRTSRSVNDDINNMGSIDNIRFDAVDLDGLVTFLGGAVDHGEWSGTRETGRISLENSSGTKLKFNPANCGDMASNDITTKLYQGDSKQRLLLPAAGAITLAKAWDYDWSYQETLLTSVDEVATINIEVPTFVRGTPAEAAAAFMLHANARHSLAISFDADTWSDADSGQKDPATGLIDYFHVQYIRRPGKTYADALLMMVRHSHDLLAINMSGDLALYRRHGLDSSYIVASLDSDDGVVSVKWRSAWEHLVNKAFVSWGSWHQGDRFRAYDAGGTGDEQTYYPSLSLIDAPGSEYYDHFEEYTDSASVTKYGERELGGGRVLFDREVDIAFGTQTVDYIAERQYFHLPLIQPATPSASAGETLRDNYMARLDYDAQLRREITVVQDFRGLDYDVGWAVQDVAVTKDGETIGDTRCIRKVVDFSDFTVTSVLLEEPPQVIYTFEDAAPGLDGGEDSYFVRSAGAAKNGAYGIAANGGNVYRTAWDTGRTVPVNGCKIGVWVKAPDDGSHEFKAPGIHFAGTGVGDAGFQAVIDMRGPALSLRRDFSSSNDINSTNNAAVQLDVWYWLEVIGSSTGFTATLYDEPGGTSLLTATRNDTTYTSGYVGLAVYSTGHFDDLTIY